MAKFRVGELVNWKDANGLREAKIVRYERTYRPQYAVQPVDQNWSIWTKASNIRKIKIAHTRLERAIVKYCDAELGRC